MNIKVTKYKCGGGTGREGLVGGDRSASVPGDIINIEYTEVGVIHLYVQCKYVWRVKTFN